MARELAGITVAPNRPRPRVLPRVNRAVGRQPRVCTTSTSGKLARDWTGGISAPRGASNVTRQCQDRQGTGANKAALVCANRCVGAKEPAIASHEPGRVTAPAAASSSQSLQQRRRATVHPGHDVLTYSSRSLAVRVRSSKEDDDETAHSCNRCVGSAARDRRDGDGGRSRCTADDHGFRHWNR